MAMMTGNIGLKNLPLSVFAIILNLKPILVILLGFCYGIETITPKKISMIIISFFGASLIVNPNMFAAIYNRIKGNQAEEMPETTESSQGKMIKGPN